MNNQLVKDAVLKIGEVSGIEGRRVHIKVDRNKNSSDLLFDGDVIKNVSVGGYVEIRKGFISLIGKADGEKLTEEKYAKNEDEPRYGTRDKNIRTLTVSLVGYIGFDGEFVGGIKELPLIGNEAFIPTEQKISRMHNLMTEPGSLHINIAKLDAEGVPIGLPIDGIFNSHIAIFGNTGSGKSNTLATLYQSLFRVLGANRKFVDSCKYLVFDFNGEFIGRECLTPNKKVYSVKTDVDSAASNKIPMTFNELFDDQTFSVLVEATDKTQKPFLKRALRFFKNSKGKADFPAYLRGIIQRKVKEVYSMAEKETAYKLLDYLQDILDGFGDLDDEDAEDLRSDVEFFNNSKTFRLRANQIWFSTNPEQIENTKMYKAVELITAEKLSDVSDLQQFLIFLHLQLVGELFKYKVQYEHIMPVINRIKAKQLSIERTFSIERAPDFWGGFNCVVINLHDVDLDMKKTIPLMLAKNLYASHKKEANKKSLNIIIDEAHNILSKTSFRETEDWKDYRLETFEEIIKEGRKFGVFVTISSQRPNDISETIISQAHNYFIHQLINQKDLLTIENAVSYIDKITQESIPTLSVGTCIFSGIATPMPLKLRMTELPEAEKPQSKTVKYKDMMKIDVASPASA